MCVYPKKGVPPVFFVKNRAIINTKFSNMKKLSLLFLFIAFTCLGIKGYAQTAASYGFSAFSSPYTSISGSGTSTTALACDDCGVCGIPIGFTFYYCGVPYTTVAANSNGFLSLGGFCAGGVQSYTNNAANMGLNAGGVGMLMAYWDDLEGISSSGASLPVYYSTTGAVGSRVFTFEWRQWVTWSDATIRANFQVKLYEASNIIDFCYGNSTYSGRTATIGIGNSLTDWQTLPNVGTAPVPSSITFTTGLNPSPANGQVYRWTTCNSGVITGAATVCVGATTNLTDIVTGGTWASGNTGVATVTGTGVVTGVSAGTAAISYTASVGCYTVQVVTVNPLPGVINGTRSVCVGLTTTLTDGSTGTWSSGSPGVATVVSGTGVVTGVSAGTSNITFTTAAGCYTVAVVTVNPLPSSISGTLSVCEGATTTLSDVSGSGTWISGNTGVATVGLSSGVVTGVAAGTSIITFTLATGCVITAVVTVNPAPTAILGASSVCAGSSISLSDLIGSGTWTSSATGTATVGLSTGLVTGVAPGVATITYSLGGGCIVTKDITVNLTPAAITGIPTVCVGSVTSLTSATAGGTWSSAITSVGTVDGSGNVTGIAVGSTVISYTIGGCSAVQVVTVNTQPGLILGTLHVCETLTTTLSDSPAGGVWSSVTPSVATISAGGVVTGVLAGTSTISYTLGGCAATAVVTVNTQPTAITGTTSVCVGSVTALTDAIGGGTWSSSAGAVGTVDATGHVTGIGAGTTIISYTLGTCATSVVVTVNTQPGAILGTLSVCQTFTTTLSDSPAGGVWSSVTTGVATITAGGVVTGVSPGTSTISYTLGGCASTAVVTVNTQPAAITGVMSVCVGFTTALTDATGGGTWSSTTTTVGTVDASGVVTGISTGTTTISYTLGTCAAFAVVTVNTEPAAITGNTGPICQTFTLPLSDATGGGVWSSVTTGVATISAGGLVTGVGVGTSVISYTLGSCAVTTIVTVNTQPAAISGALGVCQGFTTQLSDATAGGVWTSVTTAVGTVSGTGLVTGIALGTTTISYTIGSCAATVVVTVNSQPVAITGTLSVCNGFTTQLTDATGGGVWSVAPPPGVATISATGLVTGIGVGTATISYDISGCAATAIVTVNTQPAAISGALGVCQGYTTQLSDVTGGGTWTSVTPSVGTVDATGLVTGITLGTTTISYTIGSCAATAVVTVNSQPVAITGTLSVCNGFTTQLSDATGGGVWSVAPPPGIATISATGLVTGTGVGTATISYDISGCAVTAIVTVNLQPAPISGPLAVCLGLTTQLSDADAGGTWTSVTTAVATVDATGLVTGVTTGTSTISYTIGSCAATAVVTVQPLPVAISGTRTVCVGSTTSLSDATGGGTWSASNGNATVSGTGVVTGVIAGTVVITYTIGTGCTVTAVVTVNPLPSAISGANQVCVGSTVTLSDATGGGTWSSANILIAAISAGGVVTGVSNGVTTITYRLPTSCYVTMSITVNALPSLITGPSVVCPGQTINLTDAASPGTWTSSNTAVATVGAATGVVTGVAAGTANITFSLGTGCNVFKTITVNPAPAAIITPLGDTTFCPGSFVVLTANTGTGITYQWYVGGVAISGAVASSYIASIGGNYQVTELNSFGCPGTSTSMLVTVDTPIAVIGAPTGIYSICEGSNITLVANIGVGLTYQWLMGGVAIPGETASGFTTPDAGDYSVIVTNATGCSATSNVISVTVNPTPTANIVLSGPITFCDGGSVTITANYDADYSYQWHDGVGPIAGEIGQSYVASLSGSYYVTVTNGFGCSANSAITNVTANPLPDVSITPSGPTLFCAGGSVTLNAVALAGFTYQWYLEGAAISGATNATYLVTVGGGYTVKVTNPVTGCSDQTHADTVVTVVANPYIVPITSASFCWGSSSLLATSISGAVGTVTYQWYYNGVLIPGAVGGIYNATMPGDYTVQITIVGSCVNTTLPVTVTEHPLPDPVVSYAAGMFSTGNWFVTYQWYKDLVAISGATSYSTPAIGYGSYKVQVTDTNGCQSFADAYVLNTGSGGGPSYVAGVSQQEVRIYPNPAQTMVHIEAAMKVRAVISSVDGRVVMDIANAKDIDVSNIANGVYMITVYNGDGDKIKVDKLVKTAD